jgi:hypothetical protein
LSRSRLISVWDLGITASDDRVNCDIYPTVASRDLDYIGPMQTIDE